jgi:hypothetical protein
MIIDTDKLKQQVVEHYEQKIKETKKHLITQEEDTEECNKRNIRECDRIDVEKCNKILLWNISKSKIEKLKEIESIEYLTKQYD